MSAGDRARVKKQWKGPILGLGLLMGLLAVIFLTGCTLFSKGEEAMPTPPAPLPITKATPAKPSPTAEYQRYSVHPPPYQRAG